jgi:hypothetical protein
MPLRELGLRAAATAALALLGTQLMRAAEPSLEIVPEKVAVCSGAEPRGQLVIELPPGRRRPITVSQWADHGVHLVRPDDSPLSADLGPGRHVWDVKLVGGTDDTRPGPLLLRLEQYPQATAKVDVTRSELPDLSTVATVEVKILSPASDRDLAQLAVVVTNLHDVPIHAVVTIPYTPAHLKVVGKPSAEATVAPGTSQHLPFPVEVKKARPGSLLFRTALDWKESGCTRSGALLTAAEVTAEGAASQILTAVGVPSLLILPGFIMLMVPVIAWRLGWKLPGKEEFPFTPNTAEFWFFAILLSFGAVLLLAQTGRDYRDVFTLNDLMILWFVSAGAALVLYAVLWAALAAWRRREEWKLRQRTLEEDDDPTTVFEKLGRVRWGTYAHRATASGGESGFVLGDVPGDGKQVLWIAPSVKITYPAGTDEKTLGDLEGQRGPSGRSRELAMLLRAHPKIKAEWKAGGGLARPRQVSRQDLKVNLGLPMVPLVDEPEPEGET